jgi:hypothetical protein
VQLDRYEFQKAEGALVFTKVTGLPAALLAISAGLALSGFSGPATPRSAVHNDVAIQMKDVNFRLAENIALEVRSLRGTLHASNPSVPVTFDDVNSFQVEVDTAEVAISPAELTTLMNSYVLASGQSPIKHVSLEIDGDRVKQKGTIHKGIDIAFEVEGPLSATNDGNIRMHADKIKSDHIPVKGLLHLLGDNLGTLVKKNATPGMKVQGDDIILIPSALTPPPHIYGKISRVQIQDGKIVQYFDAGRHLAPLEPPLAAGAYIYHRGGTLRFGKLTMNDADLEIVGDRQGPFDFFQKQYLKQLVAGYSKSTANKGLVAHMVDYSRFSAAPGKSTQQ